MPLLSALILKSALNNDNNKAKAKPKANLKMKKKNKQQSKQTKQDNVKSSIDESKLINGDDNDDVDDDEKNLNETIEREYLNFKTLEKRNQQEREKLNELMKKLDNELITAQIDLINEGNRIDQQQKQKHKLRQKDNNKKLKSKRRHTISSVRDHIPLNEIQLKSKQDMQLLNKYEQNEALILQPTVIKKPKVTIIQNEQNGNISIIKPNTKFKSLSNIHNNHTELSSVSSYSPSIIPSTSSSSGSTSSTVSSKSIYNKIENSNNEQQPEQQQEQKFCNLFKDSIRLNNLEQFESLI